MTTPSLHDRIYSQLHFIELYTDVTVDGDSDGSDAAGLGLDVIHSHLHTLVERIVRSRDWTDKEIQLVPEEARSWAKGAAPNVAVSK